jgi:hypothetical protein
LCTTSIWLCGSLTALLCLATGGLRPTDRRFLKPRPAVHVARSDVVVLIEANSPAARLDQNLAVWEYTAGWFEDQTGLRNSTVLLPEAGPRKDYTIINHCRWDSLWDILPSLAFKRSFRTYVLAHFEANNTAAIPILYRLA